MSHLLLLTGIVVLTLMAVVDAIDRAFGRRRAKYQARTFVWYGYNTPASHVRIVVVERPAGTFVGWLDGHPYTPTNQPPTTNREK